MAGIPWEALKVAHIGRDNDDGVSLIDEIEEAMRSIAEEANDERFGDSGSVTIKITLSKAADNAVMVDGRVSSVKRPGRKQKGRIAHVLADGSLKVQAAEQQKLPLDGGKPRIVPTDVGAEE